MNTMVVNEQMVKKFEGDSDVREVLGKNHAKCHFEG